MAIILGIITYFLIVYASVFFTSGMNEHTTLLTAVSIVGGLVVFCTTLIVQKIEKLKDHSL